MIYKIRTIIFARARSFKTFFIFVFKIQWSSFIFFNILFKHWWYLIVTRSRYILIISIYSFATTKFTQFFIFINTYIIFIWCRGFWIFLKIDFFLITKTPFWILCFDLMYIRFVLTRSNFRILIINQSFLFRKWIKNCISRH